MTEYGVQTNNLFDLLNENEGAVARPKPAQAGQQQKGPKKAQAPKPAQPAKQAQAPKKPAENKPAPTQPKPAAAAQSAGGDEGYTTVGRTERPAAPQGQQGPRPQGAYRQGGQGPRPQGDRQPSQGGFRQGGQGGQQGGFRQGGQGGQQGGFRQGGQGGQQGGFRQGGQGGQQGGFRQGGQGGQQGGFRQGGQGGNRGPRTDRLDSGYINFNDREVNAVPNKATADGPRHGDKELSVPPQKVGSKTRQFDRQSSHAPGETKKGGSGTGNWGKNTGEDELKAEADVQAELAAGPEGSAPAADAAAGKKKKNKKKKAADEEEDKDKKDEIPDEKLVLFDDYVKQQAKANKPKVKLPAARQPGEGTKEDPKWATATKLDRSGDEVVYFTKAGEEKPKAVAPPTGEKKLLSKNQLKKAKERKAREAAKLKLQKENITTLFDFSAKKENERSDRGDRGDRPPRGDRPRQDRGDRPPRQDRGDRPPRQDRAPRQDRGEGQGPRGPRGNNNNVSAGGPPKKFTRPTDAPQFDDSSFPALQLQ